jgi:hypothetical protein
MDVQKASDHKNVQIAACLSFNVPVNTHTYLTSQSVHMIFTVEI